MVPASGSSVAGLSRKLRDLKGQAMKRTMYKVLTAAMVAGVLGAVGYAADPNPIQKHVRKDVLYRYAKPVRRLVGGGTRILNFAKPKLGQKVGGGQCTDFVNAALEAANRKPADFSNYKNYIWGRQLAANERMLPGDIVQFEDCVFNSPDGYTWTAPHHTAIILKEFGNGTTNGTKIVLIHQNDGAQVVSQREIDLNYKTSGSVKVFRSLPKKP